MAVAAVSRAGWYYLVGFIEPAGRDWRFSDLLSSLGIGVVSVSPRCRGTGSRDPSKLSVEATGHAMSELP